jgi:hypothetical protein
VATEIGVGLHPDGTPPTDTTNTRRWEVAGTSHASLEDYVYIDPVTLRDGFFKAPDGSPSTPTGVITGCSQSPAWSDVPTGYVLDAAIDAVVRWSEGGRAPVSAPRLIRDPNASPIYDPIVPAGQISGYASDSKGDTTGGIQLAEYGYGSAISRGAGTTGPGCCWLTGAHHFLTADELSARYPDPNEYLRDALRLTTRNVRQGFLLPGDAAQTIAGVLRIYRQLLQAGNA